HVRFGAVGCVWIVGEIAHIDVCELKILMTTSNLLLAPIDRWSMNVYSDIAAVFVEVVLQVQRHLTTATADIKHTFIRPQPCQRTQVTHKLRTRRFKTTERSHIPAQ